MKSKNLAIMFTDIKGYTARTATQSRDKTSILVEKHRRLVVPIVRGFDGRVIKGIGDAFLVAFPSSTAAVLCGMTIQDRLYKYNAQVPEEDQIHLRVAINTGEVLNIKGDVYGETVNVAARVEGITPANEVYLTEAVYLTMNKTEVTALKVGQFDLKGVPYPVTVYRVPKAIEAQHQPSAAGAGESDAAVAAAGGAAASAPPTVETNSPILVLPYGGTHLSRIEQQFFTPARKALIAGLSAAVVLAVAAALIVPSLYRRAHWTAIEQLIGEGQIDAALAEMATLGDQDDSERAQSFALLTKAIDRLLERNAPEQATELIVARKPGTADQRATHMKQLFQTFEALEEKGDLEAEVRLLASVTPTNASETTRLFDARVRLARALLARGRLDELGREAQLLVAANPRSPLGHVITGHLHSALAQRSSPFTNATTALAAYEKALTLELSAADDDLLVRNVVAAYNNDVDDPKKRNVLIEKADSLINRFIGQKAGQALSDELSRTASGSPARAWIVDRLRALGADKNIDQGMLLVQDLLAKPCEGRNVDGAKRLLERLRDEGGLRAVGALLRYGRQYPLCAEAVTSAVERIVGERVTVVPASAVQLDAQLATLLSLGCKGRRESELAAKTIAAVAASGEPRVVGDLLRFALRNGTCAEGAVRAARSLVGSDDLALACPPPPPAPACPTATAEEAPKTEPAKNGRRDSGRKH